MAYVIGVDVGGTFTDAVLDDDAGTVVAAKSPSTPPDYSQGVLDVLELLAEQLGTTLPDMLAQTHHIAHGTTSSLNALLTGNVPPVGFLNDEGPPGLDLHHERRGALPRALAERVAERPGSDQGPRAAAQAARVGDHRAHRPRRQRRRRPRRGRRPGQDRRPAGVRHPGDRDLAALVLPQPRPRTAPARAPSPSRIRTCTSRCRPRSAPGSGSSPATPRRS